MTEQTQDNSNDTDTDTDTDMNSQGIEFREFDQSELTAMQDQSIEIAKENLQTDGFLEPFAMFLCVSDGKGQLSDVPVGEETMIINPLGDVMGNDSEYTLQRTIDLVAEDPEQFREQVSALLAAAPPEEDDPHETVLNILLQQVGLHFKDITRLHVMDLIEQLNAHAVIMVHEAWMKQQDQNKDLPEGSLSDDPDSEECIMVMMETRDIQRVINVPFYRVEEKEDEVDEFEFGEPVTMTSNEANDEEDCELQGRFFGLFDENENN